MHGKIMVPLDGSELAECVLPHVEALMENPQTREVVFVRVVEPLVIPPLGESYPLDMERLASEGRRVAEEYLERVVSRIRTVERVSVSHRVLRGDVAACLAEFVKENKVDLIVIATHGRTGVGRWVWGSIADRIMRSSSVPVLMVRGAGIHRG